MMGREEILAFCLSLPEVYEDWPFDGNWMAMRKMRSRKSFAFVFEHAGRLCINVKCEPMEAEFLREVYPAITPAYHMNKKHWNTIMIDGSLANEQIFAMIEQSYQMVK